MHATDGSSVVFVDVMGCMKRVEDPATPPRHAQYAECALCVPRRQDFGRGLSPGTPHFEFDRREPAARRTKEKGL